MQTAMPWLHNMPRIVAAMEQTFSFQRKCIDRDRPSATAALQRCPRFADVGEGMLW